MLLLAQSFCVETVSVWKIVGFFVVILKIVIPLLLIILGMVDLGKAVISSDEKEINNAISFLLRRFVAAVVIFFIPTIVSALFNAIHVNDDEELKSDTNVCVQCISNVNNCDAEVEKWKEAHPIS